MSQQEILIALCFVSPSSINSCKPLHPSLPLFFLFSSSVSLIVVENACQIAICVCLTILVAFHATLLTLANGRLLINRRCISNDDCASFRISQILLHNLYNPQRQSIHICRAVRFVWHPPLNSLVLLVLLRCNICRFPFDCNSYERKIAEMRENNVEMTRSE